MNTNTVSGGGVGGGGVDYSDESDVILPRRIFVKYVVFFLLLCN